MFAVLRNLIYVKHYARKLIELDKQILLFFNQHHSLYWDQVMWVYTGKFIWIPLILSFVWVYFRQNWKDAFWAILIMVLVVTVCDQFASTICKPYFARFRPAQDPDFSQYVTIANGISEVVNSDSFRVMLLMLPEWLLSQLYYLETDFTL